MSGQTDRPPLTLFEQVKVRFLDPEAVPPPPWKCLFKYYQRGLSVIILARHTTGTSSDKLLLM